MQLHAYSSAQKIARSYSFLFCGLKVRTFEMVRARYRVRVVSVPIELWPDSALCETCCMQCTLVCMIYLAFKNYTVIVLEGMYCYSFL